MSKLTKEQLWQLAGLYELLITFKRRKCDTIFLAIKNHLTEKGVFSANGDESEKPLQQEDSGSSKLQLTSLRSSRLRGKSEC